MDKIKAAIIGMGFIGVSHIDALSRLRNVEIVGVADANESLGKERCTEYGIKRYYGDMEELINDKEIQVIHNCTPNYLHRDINLKIIEADKHVFSEKPLGLTSMESQQMLDMLDRHPSVVAGVNFCYRMNPLIQDAKNRIRSGEIGRPLLVHGHYLQDWLLYDTDYNWRIEEKFTGPSRCAADIGSHWLDLAQTLLGSKVAAVCADTAQAYQTRKKGTQAVETFMRQSADEYEEVNVTTEDYAGALLKFDNGTTGIFHCSQVSAGRKCCIQIEVDGTNAAFSWNHETSDQMWKGNRDSNNELIMRNPNFMTKDAKKYSYLPAGHPEGWNDAFKNNLSAFYSYIANNGKERGKSCEFATFQDGHDITKIIEAILQSARTKQWVSVE